MAWLLTQAVMEDNLTEKFSECPLKWGRLHTIRSMETVCYMGSWLDLCYSGVACIEVNGRTVGTFGIVHYIVHGCPLLRTVRGVPLYFR